MKYKWTRKQIEALDDSIDKWLGIVAGTKKNYGSSNCQCCKTFGDLHCAGCPIREYTFKSNCYGTPYYKYVDAAGAANSKSIAAIKAAEAELLFLLEVKRAGVPA